jgi:hypothetical protein
MIILGTRQKTLSEASPGSRANKAYNTQPPLHPNEDRALCFRLYDSDKHLLPLHTIHADPMAAL